MRVKPLVFISSTSDLAAERQALRKALFRWYDPYLYEADRPRRASPEDRCRELIERADVFVGLLGSSYGSPLAPGSEAPSICEWEFETARKQPERLDILLYLKEVDLDDELDPRQETFRRRVEGFQTGVWRDVFRTASDLVAKVTDALHGWALEFWAQLLERREKTAVQSKRRLGIVAVGAVVGSVLLLGLYSAGLVPAWTLVSASSMAVVIVLSALAILLF